VLTFEAMSITDQNGNPNTSNFEFTVQTTVLVDATSGVSSYSIDLPQGVYRRTARPLDGESQVTAVRFSADVQTNPAPAGDVVVGDLRVVSGSAIVADGRPLSGAEVQAVAVACADGTTGACMPRASSSATAVDGSFTLTLDPGQYVLSIRPADGTRLPWVNQPLVVGTMDLPAMLAPVVVPAPVAAGLRLVDPAGRPIVRAVVRVFQLLAAGRPVEAGRAITDPSGSYEMYLAPPKP
jgi:hypothetical protein